MNPANDDIEAALYVVERFIDGLRAGAPPVPKQVTDWCLKVRLTWETSACGPENSCAEGQFDQEPYTVAQAAAEMHLTERYVRRLARKGDLSAEKHGRDWLITQQAVIDYAEGRK